ncbi:MAG: nucleotidyltransferase domain-containing protein [Burkholderiales bacterium]|nr:nucleotidyltransferase domain-containing protein [Burkholderiales bacterium]
MPAPSGVQSHLRHPLTAILASAGHVRVLRVLAQAQAPQSVPQLAQASGLTPPGVRLVLDALARQHLAVAHGAGRAQLHELNRAHPLAGALAALFGEEQQRWDALLDAIRQALAAHGAAVQAAWLYGSVARAQDSPGSDVDIAALVSSPAVADRLREALMPLEDAQHLRISLTALTPPELAALPDDDPWWTDVVRDARVLKGPAPEQAKRRLAQV